jgi:glutamyl-tRNA synthetase
MSVRVRFAPSPTGSMHIGNVRTAIYNYLFAKSQGGEFIVRIEDTDLVRSTREFEHDLLTELKWLGLEIDEGPENPGEYAPYRQSERTEIYHKYAQQLLEQDLAFYCFCSEEEIGKRREEQKERGESLHYDGRCRQLSAEEVKRRRESGEGAVVRFKAPKKDFHLKDVVRGDVAFPDGMIGDFVILRESGMPVYNFCCVIDDWKMKITHVIRGEDHLPNTLRQLMIYQALDAKPPIFAHASLLVGEDRQKLSKRHGVTSLAAFRQMSFLPQTMINYLVLLGWSHPEERVVMQMDELETIFSLERMNKAPALFDLAKMRWMNGQQLKLLTHEEQLKVVAGWIESDHPFHAQKHEWQVSFTELFLDKIELQEDLPAHLELIFSTNPQAPNEEHAEMEELNGLESSALMRAHLLTELTRLQQEGSQFVSAETFSGWTNYFKKEMKIKGKPLFKGMRLILTGRISGGDLSALIPMTPIDVLVERLKAV